MLSAAAWNEPEAESFTQCKAILQSQKTLAHCNDSLRLCVYTDASDLLWSSSVTQLPPKDRNKSHAVQRHQLLCFLSGHFSKVQPCGSALEKEAYTTMGTIERKHSTLSATAEFDLNTDHQNISLQPCRCCPRYFSNFFA